MNYDNRLGRSGSIIEATIQPIAAPQTPIETLAVSDLGSGGVWISIFANCGGGDDERE